MKLTPAETAYLTSLWNQTRHIEITNLRTSDGSANVFDIDEIYTPLTTVLAPQRPEGHGEPGSEVLGNDAGMRSVPLEQALERPRLVLVGDPGSGKTTFLRRIAFEACHVLLGKEAEHRVDRLLSDDLFPIFIRSTELGDFVKPAKKLGPELLIDFLGARYPALGAAYFRRRFELGCRLLCDSLDEVPGQAERDALAELLKTFAGNKAYRATRIVASSRPGAFGGVTSIEGFHRVDIAPLSREARDKFADKWAGAVYRGDPARAKDLRDKLVGELRSLKEIRRMAENPVMLTALACLHFSHAVLPQQRSELYHSVLEWLAQQRTAKTGLPSLRLLKRMRRLAYGMQAGTEERRTEIDREDAVKILAPEFQEYPEELQEEAARRFLDEEEVNSGIIVNRGAQVRFWHLTFQEALAAYELALFPPKREEQVFEKGKWRKGQWRETLALLAGELAKQDNEPVNEFLGKLLDKAGASENPKGQLLDQVRCAGLINALLGDLAAWQYTMPQGLKTRYSDLLREALKIFDTDYVREFGFEERLAAAEALGQAGDPRIGREENWRWREKEKEPFQVKGGAPFRVGKYLVTVGEFQQFVDAGGYEEEHFWGDDTKREIFGKVSEPIDWEKQLDHLNWPVTRVSWFEAAAYCAWKSAQTGRKIRLPSEAEWEAAARCGRKQVEYPWGNDKPDGYKANYYHDGPESPKHPTPVGLYPEGATPDGIEDMAGNVWEWSQDWYEKDKYRSVRGGAWGSYSGDLRVSSRVRVLPGDRSGLLGFRCVREE